MVVIRLARIGKKKQAFYRVVAADSKRPVTAKFIEILGWYNPHSKELNIKQEKVEEWLKKGARPSNSLAVILKNNAMKLPAWVEITEKNRKPKKEVEKPAEQPKEEKTEDVVEKIEEVKSDNDEKTEAAEEKTEEVSDKEGDKTPESSS
jgi:small subunit ribosomal protein S16